MQNECGNIKAILADMQGKGLSSSAKLLAVLELCGVTDWDEQASLMECSHQTLRAARAALRPRSTEWFKFHVSVLNDARAQKLAPNLFKTWINHQCVCTQFPNSIISDADMAWRLRMSLDQWQADKSALIEAGMISADNKALYRPTDAATDRPGPIEWKAIRQRIFERDDFTCRYCGDKDTQLECDHVIPVSRGGGHEDDNLVTACKPCNRAKRDKIVSIGEWSSKRRACK